MGSSPREKVSESSCVVCGHCVWLGDMKLRLQVIRTQGGGTFSPSSLAIMRGASPAQQIGWVMCSIELTGDPGCANEPWFSAGKMVDVEIIEAGLDRPMSPCITSHMMNAARRVLETCIPGEATPVSGGMALENLKSAIAAADKGES